MIDGEGFLIVNRLLAIFLCVCIYVWLLDQHNKLVVFREYAHVRTVSVCMLMYVYKYINIYVYIYNAHINNIYKDNESSDLATCAHAGIL